MCSDRKVIMIDKAIKAYYIPMSIQFEFRRF